MTSFVNQPSTPQHSPPPSWNTGVCGWIPVFWWELVDASTWFMMDGYTKNRCVYLKTENSRLLKRKKLPWRWLRDMVPPRIPWVSREVTWWLWKLFCFGMNEIHQCSMTKVKKSSKYKLVSGFKYFFNLQPYLGKWSPIWRAYFSDGLVKNHQLEIVVFWDECSMNLQWQRWIKFWAQGQDIFEFKQHQIKEHTTKKHVHVGEVFKVCCPSDFWVGLVMVWNIWFPNKPSFLWCWFHLDLGSIIVQCYNKSSWKSTTWLL